MRVTYRAMEADDYDAVMRVWRRARGVSLRDVDSRKHCARYLERNPGLSLVAQVEGSVVGAVLCGHDGRRGYLHHLAVDPLVRRRGIGAGLAERALDGLREQGIGKCHLFVLADNDEGRAFWSSSGWARR